MCIQFWRRFGFVEYNKKGGNAYEMVYKNPLCVICGFCFKVYLISVGNEQGSEVVKKRSGAVKTTLQNRTVF